MIFFEIKPQKIQKGLFTWIDVSGRCKVVWLRNILVYFEVEFKYGLKDFPFFSS